TLAGDRLLHALLEAAPVRDPTMERVLTVVRSIVLRLAAQTDASSVVDEATLAFACALARQCFINEYVFAGAEADVAHALALRDRIEAALATGAPVPPMWLAAIGCFAPLHSLAQAASLSQRAWPEAINGLLVQQVQEPASEHDIAATLPALTA